MHSNMQITDSIYSSLSGSNLRKRIDNLSLNNLTVNTNEDAIDALEIAIKLLKG